MYQLTRVADDTDSPRLAEINRLPQPSDHKETTMNRSHPLAPIRRLAGALAALAGALLAAAAAAPAAFALPHPPEGGGPAAPPRTVHVIAGIPGWQVALIAIGAALLAAAMAVFLDRARAARRHEAAMERVHPPTGAAEELKSSWHV